MLFRQSQCQFQSGLERHRQVSLEDSLLLLLLTVIQKQVCREFGKMDVIWKELSDNNPECRRLLLYSETDPGTGATFAVRCNATIGVTSEDNFTNDAMYLVEGVLPTNHTLEAVEIDWSFLEPLEEEERDHLLRGVASIQSIKEILIRGGADDESRLDIKSILVIPELASELVQFSVEISELTVQDPVDLELLACHLRQSTKLESIHLRGLLSSNESKPLDCNILLRSLSTLPSLRVLHLSQKDGERQPVSNSTLRQVCRLPSMTSLSLMNMGLTDKHCTTFLESLKHTAILHSLVLVDNPGITETGNGILLDLLRQNRSIFNSTFGTDSDTEFRVAQLSLLHMNRCGRKVARSPANLTTWTSYMGRINETVPEELELGALFEAIKENPEFFIRGRGIEVEELKEEKGKTEEEVLAPRTLSTALSGEGLLDLEEKALELRRVESSLAERERLLSQREDALTRQLQMIQGLEREKEKEQEHIVEDSGHDDSDLKSNGTLVTVPSSLSAWDTFSHIEQQTNETLQLFRDECWTLSSLGSIFRTDSFNSK